MADDEPQDEVEVKIPEVWLLANPPTEGDERSGPKMAPLMRLLAAADPDEASVLVQERDPATGHSLMTWATLQKKFILVEWLYKRCGRAAFAFSDDGDKEVTVFDKWIESRKEALEREAERAAQPPEEQDDDEERPEEPPLEQVVYEALSEHHADWEARGEGIVKRIGELGIYQGARDGSRAKSGIGQSLFVNGDMYTGQYRNNIRHGLGTYVWANEGVIYTGEWQRNVRWGVGRLVLPDGSRYLGGWLQDAMHGEGRYTYPDGSSYTGEWVRGIKDGYGTYQFTDGSQYIGTFIEGKFVQGEWRLAGGLVRYYGHFDGAAPQGRGVFVSKYGTERAFRQEGIYRDGRWQPLGPIVSAKEPASMSITVGTSSVPVSFAESGRAYTIAQLSACLAFPPLLRWAENFHAASGAHLDELRIVTVTFDLNAVTYLLIDATYVDHDGRRTTERFSLQRPTTSVLILLRHANDIAVVVESAPCAVLGASSVMRLPVVRVAGDRLAGPIVDATASALRLSLTRGTTCALQEETDDEVLLYSQEVHEDLMTTLQQRLDTVPYNVPLTSLAVVKLAKLADDARDPTSMATARRAMRLQAAGSLPVSTVEPQRPPTPLPPKPEPRPNIVPLLEALDATKSASKVEA